MVVKVKWMKEELNWKTIPFIPPTSDSGTISSKRKWSKLEKHDRKK